MNREIGKNFSCNQKKSKRNKSDFYQTPPSMINQLLDFNDFNYNKKVLEPACGNLSIVKELKKRFNPKNMTYFDIKPINIIDCVDIEGVNFLTISNNVFNDIDYIITNPPYSLAFEFIQHSKKIAREKFAMLLPLNYLHGKKRYDKIWQDNKFPLEKIYVFVRYPLLTEEVRDDGKYNTGMMVYAWFVWNKLIANQNKKPEINWIDNDKFVL